MKLERRNELLGNTKEVINLINEIWQNQDSLLISLEDSKAIYVSICDDLNDSYNGQCILFKSDNYSSYYCFIPDIRDMLVDVSKTLNECELKTSFKDLITELNKIDPNLL